MVSRLFHVLTLLPIVVFASPTWAGEHERFRLVYVASEDTHCPDEASFRNMVAARLGYDPFDPSPSSVIRVDVIRARGRLRGRAEVTRAPDAPLRGRELAGEVGHCEALTEALATSLAIALDPMHTLGPAPGPAVARPPAEAPPAVAAVPLPPVSPPTPSPDPARGPPPARDRVSFFGVAGGVASVGAAPSATLGGQIALGMRVQSFSLEVEGRAESTPAAERVASGDPLEATLLTGALIPCANLGAWSGCALLRLGTFDGSAANVTLPQGGSTVLAAAGVRIGYSIRLSRLLALRPTMEGAIALTRTELTIDGTDVWEAPPVLFGVGLAIVVDPR